MNPKRPTPYARLEELQKQGKQDIAQDFWQTWEATPTQKNSITWRFMGSFKWSYISRVLLGVL